MEIDELGARLRSRRAAAGRTIASVAAEAGLSVPYIANLENGRGNPTLSAVNSLAAALGAHLAIDLVEGRPAPEPPAALPDSLVQFSRTERFAAESARLAAGQSGPTGAPPTAARERLLRAMAGLGALAGRPLGELDWHRLLDAVVLISRS